MSISDTNPTIEPFPNHPIHLINSINVCDTDVFSAHTETKTTDETKAKKIMPGETITNNATVSVANLHTSPPLPPIMTDQTSDVDDQEDFDRTTQTLGAHKWVFNYKEVSFGFSRLILTVPVYLLARRTANRCQ